MSIMLLTSEEHISFCTMLVNGGDEVKCLYRVGIWSLHVRVASVIVDGVYEGV